MADLPVIHLTADGWCRGGRPWTAPGPWVGVLQTGAADRRGALLAVAARARAEALTVTRLDPAGADPDTVLETLAVAPPATRPLGLLLGEAWQEVVASRCAALTGAAAELGLADAVRIDGDENWHGHHLLAGAVEAFLAQVWPESAGVLPHAVILGGGATAQAAALAAAHRGAAKVTVVATEPRQREDLAGRLGEAIDWPPAVIWQVTDRLDPEPSPAGIWVRATDEAVAHAVWLPDAAGQAPCLVVDLVGVTAQPPLGFARPSADGVQAMAAGLAAAWYLGPPVPWGALTADWS